MQNTLSSSALNRPIDMNYPTNRAIVTFSIVAMPIGFLIFLLHGTDFLGSILGGLSLGFSVFYGWALAREIDPEHDLSAFVAAGLTFISTLVFGTLSAIGMLGIFAILQQTRILNRVVGLDATPTITIVVLIVGGLAAFATSWLWGLVTAITLFLNTRLPKPVSHQPQYTGIALIIAIIAAIVRLSSIGRASLITEVIGILLIISGAFAVIIFQSRNVYCLTDVTRETLFSQRVQATQILMLAFAWIVAIWHGTAGILLTLPLWCVFLGTPIYRIIAPFLPGWDLSPRQPTSQDSK